MLFDTLWNIYWILGQNPPDKTYGGQPPPPPPRGRNPPGQNPLDKPLPDKTPQTKPLDKPTPLTKPSRRKKTRTKPLGQTPPRTEPPRTKPPGQNPPDKTPLTKAQNPLPAQNSLQNTPNADHHGKTTQNKPQIPNKVPSGQKPGKIQNGGHFKFRWLQSSIINDMMNCKLYVYIQLQMRYLYNT